MINTECGRINTIPTFKRACLHLEPLKRPSGKPYTALPRAWYWLVLLGSGRVPLLLWEAHHRPGFYPDAAGGEGARLLTPLLI